MNRNNPYESNLFGILEGRRKKTIAEEERKTMELAAALELQKKNAGILSDNELSVINTAASTKTYIILGVVLVLVVGIAVYFKFRNK
jgi:hypothetical protein